MLYRQSVCVRLKWVNRVVQKLRGSSLDVACVVGFHEGSQDSAEKAM